VSRKKYSRTAPEFYSPFDFLREKAYRGQSLAAHEYYAPNPKKVGKKRKKRNKRNKRNKRKKRKEEKKVLTSQDPARLLYVRIYLNEQIRQREN
jgi:hypothetical protein